MSTKVRDDRIEQAVAKYEKRLLRFTRHLSKGDIERAEDLVQYTFQQLTMEFNKKNDLQDSLWGWLVTVCRNRFLDEQRNEQRKDNLRGPPIEDKLDTIPSCAPGPDAVHEKKERESWGQFALKTLPDKEMEVIRLHFYNQLSYKEISDVTGHSKNHVGVLIHVGMRRVSQLVARLETLTPQQKEMLNLSVLQGLTAPKISDETGLPVNKVRDLIQEGIQLLSRKRKIK